MLLPMKCFRLILMFERHGQRFAFWTDEARSLLQGTLQPVYRVPRQKTISEKVPAHIEAVNVRTAEERKLVDFIVKLQGSEEHLVVLFNNVHIYSSLKTNS